MEADKVYSAMAQYIDIISENQVHLVDMVQDEIRQAHIWFDSLMGTIRELDPFIESALDIALRKSKINFLQALEKVCSIHTMSRKDYAKKYGVTKAAVSAFVKTYDLSWLEYSTMEKKRRGLHVKLGMDGIDTEPPYDP